MSEMFWTQYDFINVWKSVWSEDDIDVILVSKRYQRVMSEMFWTQCDFINVWKSVWSEDDIDVIWYYSHKIMAQRPIYI